MKTEKFLIPEGSKLDLKDHPTDFTGDYTDKKEAEEDLAKNIAKLRELQDVLYAEDRQSLLIIFQAMDAAGKDGAIEHVMSGVNPQGCHVVSFKQPSDEELSHDFLWRCAKNAPERGKIGYSIARITKRSSSSASIRRSSRAQHLPDEIMNDKQIWKKRFEQIRNFESNLAANGTQILKFFLNVSKEEQKARFLSRIAEEEKNWKFSMGDVKERGFWKDYMEAYTDAIKNTSTEAAPWYIIPSDKKWFTRLAVSEVIVKKLASMKPSYPVVTEEHQAELLEAKRMLEAE
jgi:PPK2 family polyphosphate:nucleotide phosphotransferase